MTTSTIAADKPTTSRRLPAVRERDERDVLVTNNRRLSFYAARLWAERLSIDLDEARSECDVALIKAASLWRADGGQTFAGYAVRAMFHQLLNYSKKERRRVSPSAMMASHEPQANPNTYDPAEVASDRSELDQMYAAIARLDSRSRQVMMARAKGEEFGTIAERFGVSRQRIQQIEQRARQKLLEELRGH